MRTNIVFDRIRGNGPGWYPIIVAVILGILLAGLVFRFTTKPPTDPSQSMGPVVRLSSPIDSPTGGRS